MIKMNRTVTVKQLVREMEDRQTKFDNAIQRGFVWDKKRMSLLIDSAIRNYPIPDIYTILDSEIKKGKKVSIYDCIDGKQRSTTFYKFLHDQFCLNGLQPFEDVELNGKYFSDLSEELQDKIKDYQLTMYYFADITDEEVTEIMSRLNNGKVLTGTESARIKAKNLPEIQKLANHELFADNLSDSQKRAYIGESLLVKLTLLMNEITDLSISKVRYGYENYTFDNRDDYLKILDFVSYALENVEKEIRKKICKATNLLTVLYVAHLYMESTSEPDEEFFGTKLSDFFENPTEEYLSASREGTNKPQNVMTRNDELWNFVQE